MHSNAQVSLILARGVAVFAVVELAHRHRQVIEYVRARVRSTPSLSSLAPSVSFRSRWRDPDRRPAAGSRAAQCGQGGRCRRSPAGTLDPDRPPTADRCTSGPGIHRQAAPESGLHRSLAGAGLRPPRSAGSDLPPEHPRRRLRLPAQVGVELFSDQHFLAGPG